MFVADYMTKEPLTIQADLAIADAKKILADKHFRHLPVVDSAGCLIGMVTDRDIRSAYPSSLLSREAMKEYLDGLQTTPVSTIMSSVYYTLSSEATLDDALLLLDKGKVGALPVIGDDRRLVGIFSIRDLLKAYRLLFGIGERGSSLMAVKDDGRPNLLSCIAGIFEDNNVVFTRMLRVPQDESGQSGDIYVRLNTYNIHAIRKMLQDRGLAVVTPAHQEV